MKKRILAILLSTAMMVQAFGVIPAMAIEATPETEIAEEETAEALPAEETEAVAPEETEAPEETAAPEETVAPAPTKAPAPAMAPMALGDDDYGVAPQEMDDEDEGIAPLADYSDVVEAFEDIYYEKQSGAPSAMNTKYLIYNPDSKRLLGISGSSIVAVPTYYDVYPDTITGPVDANNIWFLETGSYLKANNGQYLYINLGSLSLRSTSRKMTFKKVNAYPNAVTILYDSITSGGYLYVGSDGNPDSATALIATEAHRSFYLYKEINNGSKYRVIPSVIKNVTSRVGESSFYTESTWNNYVNALNNAVNGKTNDEATAYGYYEALIAAVANLELKPTSGNEFSPTINWTRTNEPKGTAADKYGRLVVNVPYITDTPDGNYSVINWGNKVNDILALTTDPTMTVWDYNTSAQYSDATKRSNIKAATWNEHEQGSWQDASVRLFDGEFRWPIGFDVDDTASLISVNDANYQGIYDRINANTTMKARFEGSHVIAVNDDMFVFVYKDGETLTAENYLDHLVFWSGSSGKGRWSASNTGADWVRTTPATFNGISATPAYYGNYPNNMDIDGSITTRQSMSSADKNAMEFSGGWYTLVNTSTLTSTLKNLYGNEDLSGQNMHIAIFAFDNSGTGGMDQLQLTFKKKPETSTSVEVRYWLNGVGEHSLGSSYMNNVAFGEVVTLQEGTNVNELNYRKAAAIAANNSGDVRDGVQENTLTVIQGGNNVIDVVYTSKNTIEVTLTSETKEVAYDGTPKTANVVTVAEVGQESFTTTAASSALNGGNYIYNISASATATLPGRYSVAFAGDPFVSRSNGANPEEDALRNYTIKKNVGTLTITYASEEATVTYDFATTNEYDILDNVEKAATITTENENVEIEGEKILYSPSAAYASEDVTLTLTFAGGYQVTKTIHFVAASNVLYEAEDFLSGAGWDVTGAAADTVVDDNEDSVFGFADAYDEEYEYSNNAAMYATLDASAAFAQTAPLTFTFKGTGFDLISECSDNTGILFVQVTGNGVNKAYMVDTYFSREDAYQVPVVRNLDLPYGEYKVTVTGMIYQSAGAVSSKARVATYALSDPAQDAVDAILAKVGYTGSDLTVSFADENSVLNGGSGSPALAPKAATTSTTNSITSFFSKLFGRNGASTLSLDPEDGGAGSEGIYAYVDAFRVYQPTGSSEPAVYGAEAGTKFYSLYDFVCASADEIDFLNNAFIYREYDEDMQMSQIAAYKEQGPENEIYLKPGAQIAFVLNNYNEGDVVQIGAKAVTEGAILNNGAVLSMTEMYYDVEVNTDPEVGAYVLIESNGESGILAVNTLKVSSGITCSATQTLVNKLENTTEEEAFVPQNFTATYTAAVKSGKATAISIKASVADVAKVEVKDASGNVLKTYTKGNATNSLAVSLGMSSSYTYSYTTAKITASTTYNIVAYNADGVASEPIAVTINLK